MNFAVQIKLLPTKDQEIILKETIKTVNCACNIISDICHVEKIYNHYKIHHRVYYAIKQSFGLSSQMTIRAIAKTAKAYKIKPKGCKKFKEFGSIQYDDRILRYGKDYVSIWTTQGRINIPYVCKDEHFNKIKGEANLVYKKGKFYLFQNSNIEPKEQIDFKDFIGIDLGIASIATLSNGKTFSSSEILSYKNKRRKIKASIQKKGTKNSKKVLKRLSGKERNHVKIINHTISKQIVQIAKNENSGIVMEKLTGITRGFKKSSKELNTIKHQWSFDMLQRFIQYKATKEGIPVLLINPAYTSQTCHKCLRIGNRVNQQFECKNCQSIVNADENASKVIRLSGASVNMPEKSVMYCVL